MYIELLQITIKFALYTNITSCKSSHVASLNVVSLPVTGALYRNAKQRPNEKRDRFFFLPWGGWNCSFSPICNKVEFRVGKDAPARPVAKGERMEPARKLQYAIDTEEGPVAEKAWLKPTGPLPLGTTTWRTEYYDGCDFSGPFDGCHLFYIKVCGQRI